MPGKLLKSAAFALFLGSLLPPAGAAAAYTCMNPAICKAVCGKGTCP